MSSSSSITDSFASLYNPPEWRNEIQPSDRVDLMLPMMTFLVSNLPSFMGMGLEEATPAVARLEGKLIRSAFSKEEYKDVGTLEGRLHSIFHLERTLATTENAEDETETTGSCDAIISQPFKRQRVEQTEFLLNNQLGPIKHIYSFIDGLETFRHIRINRFTARNLTQCIERINISTNVLRSPGKPKDLLSKILLATPQLQYLQIDEEDSSAFHDESAMSGNTRIIRQLAASLDQGMAKELRFLSICLDFTFASSSSAPNEGEDRDLVEALSKGRHSNLAGLRCRQFLRQMSVVRLSEAIAQGKLPSLKALDLCGNGIGEQGARALWLALASHSVGLIGLALSGNILTDRDAKRLAKTLEESTNIVTLLRLEIRDNFIGDEGRQALESVFQQERYAGSLLIADSESTDTE
ncbi:MAG: hypothetical protein SGILL_007257 [Bacillariaceae sp.]